jgi:hypothetical protein
VSDPTPGEAPRRESVGGVLGVGFGLALIAALVLAVVSQRARSLEPEPLFQRWFQPAELPFGLVPLEAARQPGGETLLRLSDPEAPPEAPRTPPPRGAAPTPVDWAALAAGPEGEPPTEALLVTWPLRVASGQIDSLFSAGGGRMPSGGGRGGPMVPSSGGGGDPLMGLGPQGGRRVLERGALPWGPLEAPFVLERSFEPGGTFVDTLRVNLSTVREPLVLFLRWPRGLPASTERATELLAALRRPVLPADG